jgi:hypothetical protein
MALVYVIKSENEKLKEAGRLASLFFKQLDLGAFPTKFNFTSDSYLRVYENIISSSVFLPDRFVIVETYRPWNRFTKAIAYASKGTIYVNEYKLKYLELADYVGNFAHEFTHTIGYSHNGNKVTQFNLGTVPYVIGGLAESWARALKVENDMQLMLEGV